MTTKTANVTITPARRGDLTCQYDGQYQPQPTFIALELRDGGELYAAYNPEIGNAVPMDVYHGHIRRYPIHTQSVTLANKLMRQILPLAERVWEGYESAWNGSNHVARFTEDAQFAERDIERILSEY